MSVSEVTVSGEGSIAARGDVADRAAIGVQPIDHLAERQHARKLPELHYDHRADIQLGHQIDRVGERRIRRNGIKRSALDSEYVGDFHGFSCRDWR